MGIRRRVDGGTPHNYRNELVTFIESDDGGEPVSTGCTRIVFYYFSVQVITRVIHLIEAE